MKSKKSIAGGILVSYYLRFYLSLAIKCLPIKNNVYVPNDDKILAKLDSPYLLNFVESFKANDEYYIVTEYCSVCINRIINIISININLFSIHQ